VSPAELVARLPSACPCCDRVALTYGLEFVDGTDSLFCASRVFGCGLVCFGYRDGLVVFSGACGAGISFGGSFLARLVGGREVDGEVHCSSMAIGSARMAGGGNA